MGGSEVGIQGRPELEELLKELRLWPCISWEVLMAFSNIQDDLIVCKKDWCSSDLGQSPYRRKHCKPKMAYMAPFERAGDGNSWSGEDILKVQVDL